MKLRWKNEDVSRFETKWRLREEEEEDEGVRLESGGGGGGGDGGGEPGERGVGVGS